MLLVLYFAGSTVYLQTGNTSFDSSIKKLKKQVVTYEPMNARQTTIPQRGTVISIGLINNGITTRKKKPTHVLCCTIDFDGQTAFNERLPVKPDEIHHGLDLFADAAAEHIFDLSRDHQFQLRNGLNNLSEPHIITPTHSIPVMTLVNFQASVESRLRI